MRYLAHFIFSLLILISLPAKAQREREFFGLMGNVTAATDTFFRPGMMFVQKVTFGANGKLKCVNGSLWKCYDGGYTDKQKIGTFTFKSHQVFRDSIVVTATSGDQIIIKRGEENVSYRYVKAFSVATEKIRIQKNADATPADEWSKAKKGFNSKAEYIREMNKRAKPYRTLFDDSWPYDMSELVGSQSRGICKIITIDIDIIAPTCGISIMQEALKAEFDKRGNVSRVTGWRGKVIMTRDCTY